MIGYQNCRLCDVYCSAVGRATTDRRKSLSIKLVASPIQIEPSFAIIPKLMLPFFSNRQIARSSKINVYLVQSRRISHVVQSSRPFRMAVIGSGPAGFYTAYKVMSSIQNAKIDMYECLPVPFGLVRFGVAPDHPEVKV